MPLRCCCNLTTKISIYIVAVVLFITSMIDLLVLKILWQFSRTLKQFSELLKL